MREIATVTSKGQVTLPRAVRKRMQVEPGSRIAFEQRGADMLLTVIRDEDVFEQFRGIGTPGIGKGRKAIQQWVRDIRGDL